MSLDEDAAFSHLDWHLNRAVILYLRYADPALANPRRESDAWAAFLDFCDAHDLDADAVQYHVDEMLSALRGVHERKNA